MNGEPEKDPLSFSPEELAELQRGLVQPKEQQQAQSRTAAAVKAAAPEPTPEAEDGLRDGAEQRRDTKPEAPPKGATVYRFPTSRGAGLRASVLAAVAKAIAAGDVQDRPIKPTARSIHAEMQQLRQRRMQEAGIKPIRIPKQGEKLRAAVIALLTHSEAGKKPSALQAAWEAGAAGDLGKKLAYRVKVKRADVAAGLCLIERTSPFVKRLRSDAGWLRTVTSDHPNLSALARVLANAQLSLAQRAGPSSATAEGQPKRRRAEWHAEAMELRAAGWTGNRIANHLGLNVKTVESVLSRDKKRRQKT